MTYYKGNQSGGIIGVLPGPPPNPPDGCKSGGYRRTTRLMTDIDRLLVGIGCNVGDSD